MKKITVILISLLLIMSFLGGCGKNGTEAEDASTEYTKDESVREDAAENNPGQDSPTEYVAVVYVTINPELALYLDGDNKVIAAECLNDDAAEVFSDI